MTLNSFKAFTVTVTPQSVLWKYRSKNKPLATPPRKTNRPREFDRNTRQSQITEQPKSPQGSDTRTKNTIYHIKPEYKAASSHFPRDTIAIPDRTHNKLDLYHRTRSKCTKHVHIIQSATTTESTSLNGQQTQPWGPNIYFTGLVHSRDKRF